MKNLNVTVLGFFSGTLKGMKNIFRNLDENAIPKFASFTMANVNTLKERFFVWKLWIDWSVNQL